MGKLLREFYKILKAKKMTKKFGWKLHLDDENEFLNVGPISIIAEDEGMLQVSFVKDAVPLAVARLIQILERKKLKYDLYEHFRFDEEGDLIVESKDKHFWDDDVAPSKSERHSKSKESKSKEINVMFR